MSASAAVEAALEAAGRASRVRSARDLSGGCIHRVSAIDLEDGERLVAKTNTSGVRAIFEEEAAGLRALGATGTVLVPEALAVAEADGEAVLLLSWIEPEQATEAGWRRLGEALADLHGADVGPRYGFARDNHLGSTPQPNAWSDDWVAFNAERRIGHQLRLGRDAGVITPDEGRRIQELIDHLDRHLPRRPHPALLHGDLWSGNAMPTTGDRVALIDPATYVGDGWADIAMMRLFGGFSPSCYEAYAAAIEDREGVEGRIAVYQLYHVMNHVNLFGRGYAGQMMSLVGRVKQ
jgi:fructosamine-3-kinase